MNLTIRSVPDAQVGKEMEEEGIVIKYRKVTKNFSERKKGKKRMERGRKAEDEWPHLEEAFHKMKFWKKGKLIVTLFLPHKGISQCCQRTLGSMV